MSCRCWPVVTGYETISVKLIFYLPRPSVDGVLRLSCHVNGVSEFHYYGGREDVTSISSQGNNLLQAQARMGRSVRLVELILPDIYH
jgi:hypothetical protein